MVFNSTFNNISAISRRAVLLVEKTGVPGENHRPVASHGQSFKWSVPYLVNNASMTQNTYINPYLCMYVNISVIKESIIYK
jgi:hypothetical protein